MGGWVGGLVAGCWVATCFLVPGRLGRGYRACTTIGFMSLTTLLSGFFSHDGSSLACRGCSGYRVSATFSFISFK